MSDASKQRIEGYANRIIDAAVLGIPVALINWGTSKVVGPLTAEPWRILIMIVPLAAGAVWWWRSLAAGAEPRLRGRFLLFLICYLSAFTLAAGTDVLAWRRSLIGFDDASLPRHWIAPAGYGDWRYSIAPRPPREPSLLVVTMDPPVDQTIDGARFEIAQFISTAAAAGARGVALDFHFDAAPSDADAFFCLAVQTASIPVIVGFAVETLLGHPVRGPDPPALTDCLEEDLRGHLLGYREADGVVRNVPLRLANLSGAEALSLQIARVLTAPEDVSTIPPDGLLQYLEPDGTDEPVTFEALKDLEPARLRALLANRFLLVGERSEEERFRTPYGPRLGVQVHAAAVQSLMAGQWLKRVPWWYGFLVIVVGCYMITALAAGGATRQRLITVAAAITIGIAAAAIAAARTGVWLEVVYVSMAVWGITLLFVASDGARALRSRRLARTDVTASDAPSVAAGGG